MVIGLIIYLASGIAIAGSSDFAVSLVLRVMQGIGFALSTPIITAIIGDMYEGSKEATAQGFRVSAIIS